MQPLLSLGAAAAVEVHVCDGDTVAEAAVAGLGWSAGSRPGPVCVLLLCMTVTACSLYRVYPTGLGIHQAARWLLTACYLSLGHPSVMPL